MNKYNNQFFYFFVFSIFSLLISCTHIRVRPKDIINDLEKENFKGQVKTLLLYETKTVEYQKCKYPIKWYNEKYEIVRDGWIRIGVQFSLKDFNAIDTIITEKVNEKSFNKYGNLIEERSFPFISLESLSFDGIGSEKSYYVPDSFGQLFIREKGMKKEEIDFETKVVFNYDNKNLLINELHYSTGNILTDSIIYTYDFKKRYIEKYSLFENGGIKEEKRIPLSIYGAKTPNWVVPSDKMQFDKNRNLIVEGEIHYYYESIDQYGNWTKATKYLNGPDKKDPIFLRREISYY